MSISLHPVSLKSYSFMTELYCEFYIKSNGFLAKNRAFSTLSGINYKMSRILWKPSLDIVEIFLKKISGPL